MSKIFISYKRLDKDKVFSLKDKIEASTGERCWIDLDGIESDAQFANVIINAINECEIFLFMYSSAHSRIVDQKNDWTIRELNFAQYKKKRVVFVNIDASALSDWFYMIFGTMQQIDATNSESLARLIRDIKVWLKAGKEEDGNKGDTVLRPVDAEKKYKITLVDAGPAKLQMVKLIKEMLGWGLKESKDFADDVPSVFPGLYSESEKQEISRLVEEVGGVLRVVCANADTQKATSVGRNDPCPCGSGKKFKNCHGRNG